jgi:undecaprenyl diphosphate synthase
MDAKPQLGRATPPDVPPELLPRHVAIAMDGNGRWAKARGLPRSEGHRAGADRLTELVDGALAIGLSHVSAYGFSTENWKRSPDEVANLMTFTVQALRRRLDELVAKGVRIRWSGRSTRLRRSVIRELQAAEEATRHNTDLTFYLCVNYGGKAELADATAAIARSVAGGCTASGDAEPVLTTAYQSDITLIGDRVAGTSANRRHPMNGPNDNTTASRTGIRRLISPWALNHLRLSAGIRFAVGVFLVALAAALFSAGYAALAALPLVFAAVHFAWGYWEMSIARSAVPRA